MSSRPLRAALLGTGSVAHLHAAALHRLEGVELVAAADLDDLSEFCRKYRIPNGYGSLEQLLDAETVDVVHLCTPPQGHADQTLAAVRAGAHVVAEKPAALSLDELDTMQEAAHRADRRLAVVFQQRTGSAVAHVRNLLGSGHLGRPLLAGAQTLWYRDDNYYRVPWRGRFATEGGGTTLSHAIHQIDLLAYLVGDWEAVSARMWRLARDIETEDAMTGTIRFRSGVVATVVGSVLSPRQVSALRIDTSVATIELEHLYGHSHANWRITPVEGADPDPGWAWPRREVPSGHEDYLRQVYAAILADEPLPPAAAAPARAMEIVTAIYASARQDGTEVTAQRVAEDPSLRGPLHVTPVDLRDHS